MKKIEFSFKVSSLIPKEEIIETFELEQIVHEFDGTLNHTKTEFGKHQFDFEGTNPKGLFILGRVIQELITDFGA